MNVSLTPELEKFVAKEVNSGLYQTASEVIRAGLRRLKEEKTARDTLGREPSRSLKTGSLKESRGLIEERASMAKRRFAGLTR